MPHSTYAEKQIDTGLKSLALVLGYHGTAINADQLTHQFASPGKPFSITEIQLAAKSLDFKTTSIKSQWTDLSGMSFPVIGRHQNGSFFVLSGLKDDKVLIHDPLEKKPLVLPREVFERDWNGQLVLIQKRFSIKSLENHFDIRWFIPAVLRYRKLFVEVIIASFFVQLFALVTPLMFQVIVDKVLVHNSVTTLNVIAIAMIAVAIFEVVLTFLRNFISSHTSNRIDVILGAKLYRHLLALPLAYFESRRVGDSVARVRELENIRSFLTGSSITLVIDLLFTSVFFAVLFFYSPLLTMIVAGSIPLYVLLSIIVTPQFRHRLQQKFDRGAENQAFLVETVSGIQTVKSMSVEPQMQRYWEEQLAGYISASFRSTQLGNIASQVAGLISKVSMVLVLWLGASLVMQGQLTMGQLIAFNMIAIRISSPVLRLVQLWQDFQQAGISIRRLGDILNTRTETGMQHLRSSLNGLEGSIEFQRSTFRYSPDSQPVLQNFNLAIKPGEVIGIAGRSGSGKSTLVKLVQGLYKPEAGRVLVGGYDLSILDPVQIRQKIGVVMQENFLFNRTVRENIALANPAMSFDAIVSVAKIAGAHDFILELPAGYDTVIEEQGSNLSGGQRQRLAIARALATNPDILLFDEATSALDYESERIIQQNMRQICQGRTVIIIAHRLNALSQADRILMLDKGRLIEQGKHDELLDMKGSYASLYQMQHANAKG